MMTKCVVFKPLANTTKDARGEQVRQCQINAPH